MRRARGDAALAPVRERRLRAARGRRGVWEAVSRRVSRSGRRARPRLAAHASRPRVALRSLLAERIAPERRALRRAAVHGAETGERRCLSPASVASRHARPPREVACDPRVSLAAPPARDAAVTSGAARTVSRSLPRWSPGPRTSLHGRMKLVMTLLVRDEADIVDAQIAYHLRCGRRLRRRDRQPLRGRDHGDPRALRARGRAPPDPRARRRPPPERVGHADGAARRDRVRRGLGSERRRGRVLARRAARA